MARVLRIRTLVAGLVVVLLSGVLAAPAGGHEDHDHDNEVVGLKYEDRGLGGYGPVGLISRRDLPDGISTLVSDEALVVAGSAELSDVRLHWSQSVDFVDQVDYQLSFRQASGFLSMDRQHLARVLSAEPNKEAFEELGLVLADAEWAEMQERERRAHQYLPRIRAAMGVVEPSEEGGEVEYDDVFGGTWIDQVSGKLVVAATKFDDETRERVLEAAGPHEVLLVSRN